MTSSGTQNKGLTLEWPFPRGNLVVEKCLRTHLVSSGGQVIPPSSLIAVYALIAAAEVTVATGARL